MNKEQKDKILKALAEDRNDYARDCNRRIAEENGKIIGADYMLQRFIDILNVEVDKIYVDLPERSDGFFGDDRDSLTQEQIENLQ